LHLAGFTQEEIADPLGVERSMICRDLQSLRDTWHSGDSPDLEEASFTQLAKMMFIPGPGQFDPRHPPLAGTFSTEKVAETRKERRSYDPRVDGYGPQLR
jgi:hypothetical protein